MNRVAVAATSILLFASSSFAEEGSQESGKLLHIKMDCTVSGLDVSGIGSTNDQRVLHAGVRVSGSGCDELLSLLNYLGTNERFVFRAQVVESVKRDAREKVPVCRRPLPVAEHFDLIHEIDPSPN